MKNVARAQWIAGFDIEDLIGSILRRGTVLGISLLAAGMLLQWAGVSRGVAIHTIQGTNVFHFILADLQHIGSITFWPTLLIHWGIAVLLYTPYARVAASVLYFAVVHRSWKHTLLGSLALAPLTYILFLG